MVYSGVTNGFGIIWPPSSFGQDALTQFYRSILNLLPGNPSPLGATVAENGVNFSVYSAHATGITLCFFDTEESEHPAQEFELKERTGGIWHGFIQGAKAGQIYGYRADGPFEPHRGLRFNRHKILLDPYAKLLARPATWHPAMLGYLDNDDSLFNPVDSAAVAPLGRVVAPTVWDQRGNDATTRPKPDNHRPSIPWKETIIYETHVKGISMTHPEVDPSIRGTYLGLCSAPILQHLKDLGITTVQLQPVHAKMTEKHLLDAGLVNYWGYSPINYFCPEPSYASDPNKAIEEFQTMVAALHQAGLEVLVDVVYNHTAEGNRMGPTVSYRGLDNTTYYRKNHHDPRYLEDFTGTGNTLDANHPIVTRLLADSLRYWVTEMGVDGFRFDLATSLARDEQFVDMQSPFLTVLQQDPILQSVKLIAEPWDLGPDGYQVGSFPAPWTEWNGKYRDTVRQFWKGDSHQSAQFATRLAGSSDLFGKRRPNSSINFITAHDGFTLSDLVSYSTKHNFANLEDNRDGHEPNFSWNWGAEGPTDNPSVVETRNRLKKALFSTLCLSQGVPMVLGGDELGKTQHGNNNAYCQDNVINWYDWDLSPSNKAWLSYCQAVIQFRKQHPTFGRRHFLNGSGPDSPNAQAIWWHPEGRPIEGHEWNSEALRVFGVILLGDRMDELDEHGALTADHTYLVVFNPLDADQQCILPSWGQKWSACAPFSPEADFEPTQNVLISQQSLWVFKAETHLKTS